MTASLHVLSAICLVLSGAAAIPQYQQGYGRSERAGWLVWIVLCFVVAACNVLALFVAF